MNANNRLCRTCSSYRRRNRPLVASRLSPAYSIKSWKSRVMTTHRFGVSRSSHSDWLRILFLSTVNLSICTTFSKCVRAGNEMKLSGSAPFNRLIRPLLKSMQHFHIIETPPSTARYFDCHVAIGVGVLDAPMVGVTLSGQNREA